MSFKIKINNEEVVSDSNLQIKEEMLSTSSTILKNCYPKSWEDDKDYTTKYYFPKDYSKCKIVDETYHPESLGTRVTGTNLHINYDNNKNWDLEELQGNTYQQTYTGKNLLKNTSTNSGDNNYWSEYSTYNQITGELTRSTTATTESFITHRINGIKNSTKYTISFMAKSNGKVKNMDIYFYNRQTQGICSTRNITLTTTYQKYTFTFTTDSSTDYSTNSVVRIDNNGSTTSGTTATLTIKDVMLVEGEDTNFEPYVGGTPSPNPDYPQAIQNVTGRQTIDVVGKNLLPNDNTTQTISGITFTKNSDGSIKINGTSTAQVVYRINLKEFTLTSGTYTLSTKSNLTTGVIFQGWHSAATNFFVINPNNNSKTTTISSDVSSVRCQIVISNNVTVNNLVIYPMLEKGSTTTEYEEYKGQSYELNLGKNLFNSDVIITNMISSLSTQTPFSYNSSTKELTITNSSNDTFLPALWGNANYINGINIDVEKNTTYTFHFTASQPDSTLKNAVFGLNKSTNKYEYIEVLSQKSSFTFNTGNYDTITFRLGSTATTGTVTIFSNFQLEKGNATTYSPYFTPIELNKIGNYQDSIKKSTGKNLFDKDNANVLNAYFNSSTPTITSDSGERTLYIPCKPNTTYTISKTVTNRFCVGYTATSPVSGTSVLGVIQNHTASSITITTGETAQYLVVFYWISTDTKTSDEVLATIQIEENSTATEYEPYGKVWYICKKTGKLTIDGTEEGWSLNTSSPRRFVNTNTNLNITNIKYGSSPLDTKNYMMNDHFRWNVGGLGNVWGLYYWYNGYLVFSDANSSIADLNTFKTWLGNNKPQINYALSTPTYTEITNTDLINQLESIELLNGINNITVSSGDLTGAIKIFYNYKEAYITEDIIFCGCVKNTGNISLNPREPHYVDLQVLDFKTLLSEGETLNYVITGKTIVEAINQVVASISDYGFVVGNIELLNPNDIINAYSTLNKTAYDVFQYIADITQSKWTTRLIDENTIAIDFYDPTLMPQAEPILNTKEYMCSHKINDISFNYSTNDYRNKQIMTSDEVFANITQTETLTADGYSKNFICQNKIGKITSITVNGVESSFVTKSEDELGLSGDFVYQPGENQFTSKNTISSGSIIVITYYAIVKGREIILNSTESSRISNQIGRKGTISRYENRNDTTSSLELQKIGQSYIKYKGNAEITLKVISENNLFNVGQIVNYDAPLNELKTDYMVKTKVIDMYLNANKIFYSYELSNNFNSENAINYFDNQRAKNQGNIGEGETITRNIDIETTSSIIFYETNIEEVEVSNPTSLDFALDGVLI